MIPPFIIAFTLAFATLCVAGDVRDRRIPNLLSGFGMVAGLTLNAAYFGIPGLTHGLVGAVVLIALLLPAFALGGIGGGDVKMMGAIGALLGLRPAVEGLLAGLALGGVIMAIHLVRVGRLRETVRTIGGMMTHSLLLRSLEPLRVSAAQPGAIALPYSVPLALGTAVVLALSWRVGS